MPLLTLRKTTAAVAAVIVVSTWLAAQKPDPSVPSGKDFGIVGGNVFNHRYSSLTRINKINVKQLGAAWMEHVAQGRNGLWMQATPIVVNGVMYITTGHITARDARMGAVKWRFPKGDIGRGGGPTGGPDNYFNRGVAVGDGKVFAPGYGATLLALDQQSGELVWRTELQQQGGPAFSNAAAVYYDGLVYM